MIQSEQRNCAAFHLFFEHIGKRLMERLRNLHVIHCCTWSLKWMLSKQIQCNRNMRPFQEFKLLTSVHFSLGFSFNYLGFVSSIIEQVF